MTRWVGVIGISLVLLGSVFAAYDSFVFGNKINNMYLPICKQWNSVISEIEPYTLNSKQPLESIKPFYIYQYGDNKFNALLAIIQMNYSSAIKSPIKRVTIDVPVLYSETRLGGRVNLEYNNGYNETMCAPDTLLQWIKDYRKNWFLKWGLIAIAIGSFLQILQELIKKVRVKMDENKVKKVIGVVFFIIAVFIIVGSLVARNLNNNPAHRLLVTIAFATLGIAAKAYFFIPFFKNASDPNAEAPQIRLSYLYYFLIIIIVIGLIYLNFYNTIIGMPESVFYLVSFIIFMSMGFAAASVIKFLNI